MHAQECFIGEKLVQTFVMRIFGQKYNWFVWPTPSKRLFQGAVLLEVALFGGAYVFYTKLNREPDFRRYANDTKDLKWTLEIYYRIGELMNKEYNGRALDKEAWGIVDPPKEN